MDDKSISEIVKTYLKNAGCSCIDIPESACKDILDTYIAPTLPEFFEKEISVILKHDPDFFKKNGIFMPSDPKMAEIVLFDLYYSKEYVHMIPVYHNVKVWLRHARYAVDGYNGHRLGEDTKKIFINNLRRIMDGTYFDNKRLFE